MRFDLYTLKLFIAVVETGSLGAASRREHIAISALSKRIAVLEDMTGAELLIRNARGVELTLAGRALVAGARTLLHGAKDLEELMRDFSSGIRGQVRVAATVSMIMQFLPRELSEFSALYPGVSVDLEEKISDAIIDAVAHNVADIGLYTQVDGDPGLQTFPYHHDSLRLLVPPNHALAGRRSVAFEETIKYDYVGLHKGSSLNSLLARAAEACGEHLRLRYQVTGFDAIAAMVRANLGIGVVPSGAVEAFYQYVPDVRVVHLTDSWAHRQSKICVRSIERLATPARLLLEHLRGAAPQRDRRT